MSGIEILVSDHHGVYVPKVFVENHDTDKWNVDALDVADLSCGPDENEWYWETWAGVLDYACYKDNDGNIWHLYQDGDLFAYCNELMTHEEYEEFFGEKRED